MNDYGGGGGDDTVTVAVKTKCVFVVVNRLFISYICKEKNNIFQFDF